MRRNLFREAHVRELTLFRTPTTCFSLPSLNPIWRAHNASLYFKGSVAFSNGICVLLRIQLLILELTAHIFTVQNQAFLVDNFYEQFNYRNKRNQLSHQAA
jgi:hypothetical protein